MLDRVTNSSSTNLKNVIVNTTHWVEKNIKVSYKQASTAPYFLEFSSSGSEETGFLSVAENIPFNIERVFWSYDIPEKAIRGEHAHYHLEQILIAVNGIIIVNTEDGNGTKRKFVLNNPSVGLYIPPHVWHYMEYFDTAVQIVLASMPFSEEEYIRSYTKFQEIYGAT